MSSRTQSEKVASVAQQLGKHKTHRLISSIGALLAYVPFGLWLADTYPAFAVAGGVLALAVAGVPDKLSWWVVPHGWTHSVIGAVAVGGLVAGGGWLVADHIAIYAGSAVVTPEAAAQYGFAVGGLAAYGHVVADGLTGTPIRPLWPVSSRNGSINLPALVDPRNNESRIHLVGSIGTATLIALGIAMVSSVATATMV